MITLNYIVFYGIRQYWKENMETLIDFMFINGGGLKEVHSPTDWSNGESVRHCEKMPLLKDIISSDNADKVKDVLESFMNTYKWGLMDVNHFAWGFMSTPTCNRVTVTGWGVVRSTPACFRIFKE